MKSDDIFTFVQLNFWNGRLYYPITRFLERIQPDIFSAQEIYTGPESTKPDHMTAEMLLDKDHRYFDTLALGGSYKNFKTANGFNRTQCCATALKKSFSIISKNITAINLLNDTDYWGNNIKSDYFSLLHTLIENTNKQPVHILNFHNPVIIDGRLGNKESDHNFEQISSYISKISGPIILSGDFNLHKCASSLSFLKNIGLKNLNDIYNTSQGRNEFSWKPEEVVSHIFINDHIAVDDYYIADDNVSDHKALVMKAHIKK